MEAQIDAAIQHKFGAIRRELARRSFLGFVEYTHPNGFRTAWHHKLICREIDRWLFSEVPYHLMLWMPPRHCKSKLCSIFLPPYIFGHFPDDPMIAASYAQNLIDRMSRQAQAVMGSKQYRDVFPGVEIGRGGSAGGAVRRANEFGIINHEGLYRCAGIGGGLSGYGAKRGLLDDMVKGRQEAESLTTRENTIEWFTSVFRTRLEKGGRMLHLTTRWHVDDLAGWQLTRAEEDPKADQWRVICLPALYEKTEWSHPDDKREEGEALWPEEFPIEVLEGIRATLPEYEWQSIFQQRPYPPGGRRIKREWLQLIEHWQVPPKIEWIRCWDLAVSSKDKSDYTASGQMGMDEHGNIYVRGFVHVREEWPKVRKRMIEKALEENVPVGLGGPGLQLGFLQDLQAEPQLRNLTVFGYPEDKDKLTRALPWIARAEQGKLFVVRGIGVDDYIQELVQFTGKDDTHDDHVDWMSGAYRTWGELAGVSTEILHMPEWLKERLGL